MMKDVGATSQQARGSWPRFARSHIFVDPEDPNTSFGTVAPFDGTQTKALIRKLDVHLVPWLALFYLRLLTTTSNDRLSFLDRTNIGNARLLGLEKDLGMKGLDYNIALAVFFPFYIIAEIPSNMILKRIRPGVWFMIIMVAWAICTTLMGLVNNFSGLLATRMLLGLAEGGLFPGINYYITMWYKRHECGFRMALFFSAATAAGAFGGLLARGIMAMDGVGGKAGWSWIFILEGLLTFLVGVSALWVIQDYPKTARFLSPAEKTEVRRRLQEDRSALADEFDMKYFFQALTDWKIYVHMLITIGIYTPLYSIALFLPTIVKAMGHTEAKAQLMTVPPYAVACLFTILGGYATDKAKTRGIFMIGFELLAIMGFALLIGSSRPAVQYAGTFLAASGVYSIVPMGVAWMGNNIGGSLKRAVGIAMHVGFGNIGGVIAAFVYESQHAPRFYQGHGILIGTLTMSLALSCVMTLYLRRENARRDKVAQASGRVISDEYTEEEKMEERGRGDYASFFRYTV